jgi:hypothetical protein
MDWTEEGTKVPYVPKEEQSAPKAVIALIALVLWCAVETHWKPGVPVKLERHKNRWLPMNNETRHTFENRIARSNYSLASSIASIA